MGLVEKFDGPASGSRMTMMSFGCESLIVRLEIAENHPSATETLVAFRRLVAVPAELVPVLYVYGTILESYKTTNYSCRVTVIFQYESS